ncbi:MAG: polyprenyl synthetase family protein [Candidatus Zixiibacteriota bacterium]
MPEVLKQGVSPFKAVREKVDFHLERMLPKNDVPPEELHAAMRYSVFAGGKRLRPVLAVSSFYACGGVGDSIYRYAGALELIHTYSLIHDDLPCMDDDDFRRGQPTLHKKFYEYIAVLAGDALHALAFEILAESGDTRIVAEVSRAIGTQGMIGGQVADVQAEGHAVTLADVEGIHRRKTAALITASIKIGALLAKAPDKVVGQLASYGENLGLAFQIVDDILDVEGDFATLGKTVGADSRLEKATYPKVVGLEKSKQIAAQLISEAKDMLTDFPEKEIFLRLADYIIAREQ